MRDDLLVRFRLSARVVALAAVCALGALAAIAVALATGAGPASTPASASASATSPSVGYSPGTLRRVYGVSGLLSKGVDGSGETIVFPETYLSPAGLTNIRRDLAAFDRRYHLGASKLTLGRALGFRGNTALADSEEVQDLEMAHAIAPAAKLDVMMVPLSVNDDPPQMASLLRAAVQRGNVVSFSQSECETTRCLSAKQLSELNNALRYARDRHVSIFASAGDTGTDTGSSVRGGTRGVRVPASSPLVTGVGGTTLTIAANGTPSETAWDDDNHDPTSSGARLSATGGGFSARYARPSYQDGLAAVGDHRGVPDVAAIAEPGMSSVLVRDGHVRSWAAGGTSASAPLWAGIAALADQDAHRQLGFLNPALYRIGHSSEYHSAFHDITTGNNTVTLTSGQTLVGYSAAPGWDPVTGWGTPNAQVLVPLLAKEVPPTDGQGL